MKNWPMCITLVVSAGAIAGASLVAAASAAPQTPRTQAACKIVREPSSVPCGKFYNLVRVCPGLQNWTVIGRRQNIC